MAGVGFKIDDGEVRERLGKFLKRAGDLSPALKAFGEHMLLATAKRFEGERDHEGQAWQKLAPATLLKKKNPRILTESSNLRGRFVYRTTANSLVIENNVTYARIHQLGGRAGRNRATVIPARPFLGVNNEDRMELAATLDDFLMEGV